MFWLSGDVVQINRSDNVELSLKAKDLILLYINNFICSVYISCGKVDRSRIRQQKRANPEDSGHFEANANVNRLGKTPRLST
jgi:hypothetical protein